MHISCRGSLLNIPTEIFSLCWVYRSTWKVNIFILNCLIQEQGMSVHLFRSSTLKNLKILSIEVLCILNYYLIIWIAIVDNISCLLVIAVTEKKMQLILVEWSCIQQPCCWILSWVLIIVLLHKVVIKLFINDSFISFSILPLFFVFMALYRIPIQLWCWRRLLRVPWTERRSNQSILGGVGPGCSLEGLMLKLKLQYFGHLMRRANSFEKTRCWERLKAGAEGDDRGWDG